MLMNKKHRPVRLKDVDGQKEVISFMSSVVKRPEKSPRNYTFLGPMGCGKTSACRAFAADLLDDDNVLDSPNYIELDSNVLRDPSQADSILSYVFSEVPGWKVVVFDEFHLADPGVQQKLLKPLEDFTGNTFFIFASTEEEGIMKPILSRCLVFHFTRFSAEDLFSYLNNVIAKEGIEVPVPSRQMMVFNSMGHMRDLLNQLDMWVQLGDEGYLFSAQVFTKLLWSFFFTPGFEVIDELSRYPVVKVRQSVDHFLRENVVKKKIMFDDLTIQSIFMAYLKLKSRVESDDDYFSMLYVWKEIFKGKIR